MWESESLWQPGGAKGDIPGPPRYVFWRFFSYIKPTQRHFFGGPGIYNILLVFLTIATDGFPFCFVVCQLVGISYCIVNLFVCYLCEVHL